MDELTELTKLGLTKGEIRIYEALLELGETTRTKLAKKSGVSPSKIYDVTNRLLDKGIISIIKKNTILHFSAAHPERLKEYLIQKEEEIKKEKLLINSLFPTLLLKYNNIKELTNVEVFEGWEGMKTVFLDMAREIPEQGENYIFGASMGKQPKKADMFFEQHRKRMEKKHYHLKIIFNEEMRNYLPRIKPYLENPMHKVKFLHHETFIEFNFYKDTVLFTILQEMPLIIRLRNNEIVDAFKKFFNTMWEQAKE